MLGVLNFLNKPLTIRWYLLNPYITTVFDWLVSYAVYDWSNDHVRSSREIL